MTNKKQIHKRNGAIVCRKKGQHKRVPLEVKTFAIHDMHTCECENVCFHHSPFLQNLCVSISARWFLAALCVLPLANNVARKNGRGCSNQGRGYQHRRAAGLEGKTEKEEAENRGHGHGDQNRGQKRLSLLVSGRT